MGVSRCRLYHNNIFLFTQTLYSFVILKIGTIQSNEANCQAVWSMVKTALKLVYNILED